MAPAAPGHLQDYVQQPSGSQQGCILVNPSVSHLLPLLP